MELIKVRKDKNGSQLVSARELHCFLEVKSRFNDWIKARIEKYGFEEKHDFVTVTEKKVTAQGNESEYTDYILKLEMAKELSMVENNEKGKQARKYFIECERQLMQQDRKKDLVFSIYKGGVDAIEAHKILVQIEVDEAVKPVQEALNVKTDQLNTAFEQIKNLIELGSTTTFDVNASSKMLGYNDMGEKKLWKFMKDKKWINLNNSPSQDMINNGRMISVLKYNRYTGENYNQTRITIKGLFWIGNKLRLDGYETLVSEDMLISQIENIIQHR